MAQKPLTERQMRDAVTAVNRFGNESEAARHLKMPRSTLQSRIFAASRNGIKPEPKPEPPTIEMPPMKPIVRVKAGTDAVYRVLAIGDAHDSPQINKDRFKWIGKHARAEGFERIVSIGDFLTLDSLNRHIPNETLQGKAKGPFAHDLDSGQQALAAIAEGLAEHKVLAHLVCGNHERRAWVYEDYNPEAQGLLTGPLTLMFEQHGWTWTPYGEFYFLGGVGFVHAALNRLGKTYGGKNAEQTIANDAVFDMVIGHSHTGRSWRAPKIGPSQFVNILNLGCALPHGHIEEYAQHATTGWTWGIYELTISGGHIEGASFVSMLELERRYG